MNIASPAPQQSLRIAVLGIGMMGYPMARRLCEAGFTIHAWNRSRAKAERLSPGARIRDTENRIYTALISAVDAARVSVRLTIAYFAPGADFVQALKDAAAAPCAHYAASPPYRPSLPPSTAARSSGKR